MPLKIKFTISFFLFFIQLIGYSQTSKNFSHPAIKDYGLKKYSALNKTLPHSDTVPWKLVGKLPKLKALLQISRQKFMRLKIG